MLRVYGLWLLTLPMLLGWGLLATRALRRAGLRGALSGFQTLWLGLATLVAWLIACSLVVPIARGVLAVSWLPAIAGLMLGRQSLRPRLDRRALVALGVSAVIGLVVAYVACDLISLYDTGLYHLQVVKWIASYRAVPGLANLHLRFGYNNTIHLFGALFDAYWEGESAHLMEGFLLSLTLAHWTFEILGARTPRGRVRQVFCLFTLPFLLWKLWTNEIPSLSTDLPLALVGYVTVLELVSLSSRVRTLTLAYVLALASLAMTVKLGGLALFAVTAVTVAVIAWRETTARTRIAIAAVAVVLGVGWIVRGVIASGWLVFPAFGRLPLSWAVPADIARDHLREIGSWSRMFQHGEVFDHGTWYWLGPWLEKFFTSRECMLLGIAVALLVWRLASGPIEGIRRAAERGAIGACLLALVQWFYAAPDKRYGQWLFWVLPAVFLAPRLAATMRNPMLRPLVVIVAFVMIVWSGGLTPRLNTRQPTLLGTPRYAHTPTVDATPAGPHTTIFFPTSSDQCWDYDLPCSPWVIKQRRFAIRARSRAASRSRRPRTAG